MAKIMKTIHLALAFVLVVIVSSNHVLGRTDDVIGHPEAPRGGKGHFNFAFLRQMRPQPYPSGRFLGSVEIPGVQESIDQDRPNLSTGFTLYSQPDLASKPAVVITEWRHISYLAHGYDRVSAIVFDQQWVKDELWYQLKYEAPQGSGTA
jgi:hypothetical protein